MFKDERTYIDYNGEERSENHYFNLSKAEIIKMDISSPGGFEAYIKEIISSKDGKRIMDAFDNIMHIAYGQKTLDGKRFIKSEELWNEYIQTEAYSDLYVELVTDAKKAANFINQIIPTAEPVATPILAPVS